MDNKRNAIAITLVISTAFTLTACGNKPSSKSSFSDSNSSYSASADIKSSKEDDSPISEQTTVTTSTTPSDSKQPSVNPQTTTPKAPTKPQTTTTQVQVITPTPTPEPVKQLILPTQAQCQIIENEIIRLVNEYRSSLGLSRYTVENKLMQAAGIRAEEASRPNCYCHKRPDGSRWGTVLNQLQYGDPFTDSKYGANGEIIQYTAYDSGAGDENLASRSTLSINQQFYFTCTDAELISIAKSMFDGWKASADHNKSMVSTIYTKIGVGVYAKYETTLQNDKDIGFYGIQTFTQR